jgi:hypothetical protein
MRKLEFEICGGIGDNLVMRIFFDSNKHNYDQIRIAHSKSVINYWRNGDPAYYNFLDQLGALLFSEPPYIFDHGKYPEINTVAILKQLNATPQKPNIDHLLCKGTPLNLNEEYIVITTKIRFISKKDFYPLSIKLWETMRELSKKYKIVVVGEKEVERSKEYSIGSNNDSIFSIYEQIIANLPSDRVIDLTIPALGITAPDLTKIQQDCLIMKESKFVIILGVGGNLSMSICVANTICFRLDTDALAELLHSQQYPSIFLTKNWSHFINKLKEYV